MWYVQSAEDVRFIRDVLDKHGGTRIKIISKIENTEGLKNFDDILKATDGVMVARGDLGMEIPSEKVRPLTEVHLFSLQASCDYQSQHQSSNHE